MKTQKTTLVLSVIMSFMLLLIIAACGDKSDSAQEKGQQFQQKEKELLEGKSSTQDLAGKTDLLTVGDIEKVTGLPGVKLVPRNPKIGAGGDLNFATADDNLLVMLVVADMVIFNQWKDGKNYAAKKLNNIGDEAYSAPGGGIQYIIFFRSGDNVASISSFQNLETGEALLTIEQLSELGRIVVSRM